MTISEFLEGVASYWPLLLIAALAIALNVHAAMRKRAFASLGASMPSHLDQATSEDGIQPRDDEKYLGLSPVVQVRRRDYDSGKVTEAIVIRDGRRQIATKFGEPLPLSAEPRDLTER